MRFRLVATGLLILFVQNLIMGQDLQKFNVSEAVRYGLNNHSRISNEKKNLEYRKWLTREEKSNYLPSVNASADYRNNINLPVTILPSDAFGQNNNGPLEIQMGTRNSLQGGINLEQELYNPVILSRIKEKEIQNNMAEVSIEAIRKSVALDIKKSYYQAVLNAEIWKTSMEILKNYVNLEKAVRVQFENGLVSENELENITNKRQNQSEEININEMKFHNSIKQLKMSMDYPDEKELTIKDSLVISMVSVETIPESTRFAYHKLPEYQDVLLQEDLSKARISTLNKNYYPRIAAYGFIGTEYYDDAFKPFENEKRWYRHSYVGIKLQIPLFEGLGRSYQKQALSLRADILSERKLKLASDLKRREHILRDNNTIASKQAVKMKNDYRYSFDAFTDMIQTFENGLTGYENVLRSEIDMMVQYQSYLNSLINVLNAHLKYEEVVSVF